MNTLLKQTPALDNRNWINLVNPDAATIAALTADFDIPAVFIQHALDEDELSRMERERGVLLIVLRIPYAQGTSASVAYTTKPLGLIVNAQVVITVCAVKSSIVPEMPHSGSGETVEQQRGYFVLHLIQRTAESYVHYLREISATVDQIENRLQRSLQNKEVLELLQYQKILTYFTTSLKLNGMLLERMQREELLHLHVDEEVLEDVIVETQEAIEMTQIASNILGAMMDAFASIISNNLNGVMKFLTVFTIILTFPGIVASLYGMNVRLPWQDSVYAFAFTLLVSLVLSLVVTLFFWRKHWL